MNIKPTSFSCAALLACCSILSLNARHVEAQQDANVLTAAASAPIANETLNRTNVVSVVVDASSDIATKHTENRTSAREALEARGIVFGFSYKTELLGSLFHDRGAEHDVSLLGSGLSSLDVDLLKMNLYRGHISLSAQTLHGTGLNESLMGTVQLPSNLDATKYTKLIEAWYGDSYLENHVNFKVGRLYADSDFGVIENGGDFLNASYGVVPTSPMPTYPDPELGVTVSGVPTERISVGAGVYRGGYLDAIHEGDPALRKGLFTLAEARLKPNAKGSSHDGAYRFGVWQQAHGTWMRDAKYDEDPVRNYGIYAVVDYWFHTHSEDDRGPGVFARWGWAPSDRNEISHYWGTGVNYLGLNPLRRQDAVGLGISQITLPTSKRETVCELFYKLQISKMIVIQPDLQWARNPSGTGANQAIAGLRLGLNF